jgi:hypothetical protein
LFKFYSIQTASPFNFREQFSFYLVFLLYNANHTTPSFLFQVKGEQNQPFTVDSIVSSGATILLNGADGGNRTRAIRSEA